MRIKQVIGFPFMTYSNFAKAMTICLTVATVLSAPGALAQSKVAGRATIIQELSDCRKLTADSARLACYDAAAAALEQAEAQGDIVVVDRAQARRVRSQAFGFSLPSLSIFERGEKQEDLANVAGQIDSARPNAAGKWVLRLEGGAIWEQTDTTAVSRRPRAGMPVNIRRAALGSFLLSVDDQHSFRARRVE